MLRIATCQMTSGPDLGANLQIAESLIRKAAREGANLALLPEMFTIMSNDPKDVLHAAERYQDGPVQKIMAGLAKSLGIWVAAGTIPLQSDDEHRVTNTMTHSARKPQGTTRFIYFRMRASRSVTTSPNFTSAAIRRFLLTIR